MMQKEKMIERYGKMRLRYDEEEREEEAVHGTGMSTMNISKRKTRKPVFVTLC